MELILAYCLCYEIIQVTLLAQVKLLGSGQGTGLVSCRAPVQEAGVVGAKALGQRMNWGAG